MSEHTAFILACRLLRDTPQDVIKVLKFMTGKPEEGAFETPPDHPFFKTAIWEVSLQSAGGMLWDARSLLAYEEVTQDYYLYIRTSLKNNANQIQKFLAWLVPYCANGANMGKTPSLKNFFGNLDSPEVFMQTVSALDEGFAGYLKPEHAQFPILIYFETGKVFLAEITAVNKKPLQGFSNEKS
jgi:hypothetical protein